MLKNILDEIISKDDDFKPQEDEYEKGGELYCNKCHTRRSVYLPFLQRLQRCKCHCQMEKIREEERRLMIQQRQAELDRLKDASLLDERYKNVSFDNTEIGDNKDFNNAYTRCKKYCEVSNKVFEEGMGIYLYGDSGTGKTHLTACMINRLIEQGWQVLITNFAEISKIIRSTFKKDSKETENDYINQLANIDFLFIDDLGTEIVQKNDEDTWLQEKIYDVINKRYNAKTPTIFTSNYSMKELITERGMMKKTVDRIMEMSTAILKIEGKSYRLKNRVKESIF